MEQESLRKATELIINAIQNSDINVIDKYELLMNLYIFLNNYDEAIKQKIEKPKCDKCKIELNEVFIQETPQRTYRLCKNCNNYYMKLMGNVNNYEKKKKR